MFTTAKPIAAMAMMTVKKMAMRGDDAGDGADLLARDLGERLAVAAHARRQDDEVVHRAAERDADEDPEQPGQEAELRRQHRADQRAGAGDGGEVVAEQHPAVGGDEVLAVGEAMRGRDCACRRGRARARR